MDRIVPFVPWIACAVLVAWGFGVHLLMQQPAPTTAGEAGASGAVTATGQAAVGGPFALVDGSGRAVTDQTFAGKPKVVFFGFTHCPDVCPAGLMHLAEAMTRLGPKADAFTPLFITVDPERDTPQVMAEYTRHFDPRIIGLTGTAEQIAEAARAYRVFYRKVPLPESALGYTMDHSSIIYVMGADGRFLTHFTHETTPEDIAQTLGALLPG